MSGVGVATRLDTRWSHHLDEPVVAVVALPDGVVAGGSEGTVHVLGPDGRVRSRLALDDQLLTLAAAADGTRLAAGGSARMRMWGLPDGRLLLDEPTGWCEAMGWTDRSGRLAYADGRHVRVVGSDGTALWRSPRLASTCTGLVWVRGERRVAAAVYQGVSIFEPGTDRLVEHLSAPGSIAGLAAAPNGRWVVGGSQDATLHGWKVPGGDDFRMSGFPGTVSALAFESTGRWMACDGGTDIACWDFSGKGPTGRAALLASGHRDRVTTLGWLPEGRQLVSGDAGGGIALFRIGPGDGPGGSLRPVWTAATGDAVTAVVGTTGGVLAGHRSGAVVLRSTG